MSDITDTSAIQYVRELRALCEQSRAVTLRIRSFMARWNGSELAGTPGVSALIPDDTAAEIREDRQAEAINNVTGANVNSVMRGLTAAEAYYDDGLMEKFCVRPVNVD